MDIKNHCTLVDIMLQGNEQLTEQENIQIINIGQRFIRSTQRFM